MKQEHVYFINQVGNSIIWFRELGFINGGNYQFACGTERGIGYYIMGILPLAIFGKTPSRIVFTVFLISLNHD